MSFNDEFIPGKWIDTIDVNDFVNLNKKPFLNTPIFLENTNRDDISKYFNTIKDIHDNQKLKIHLGFSEFNEKFIHFFDKINSETNPFIIPVSFTEDLNSYKKSYIIDSFSERNVLRNNPFSVFEEIITSDMKKMLTNKLFCNIPYNFSYNNFHGDIRIVPLYGTKFMIKEKKWILKSLEKRLKNNDWVQMKIDLLNQIRIIEEFEVFANKFKINVSKPSKNSSEVLNCLIITSIFLFLENPSLPFKIDQIIPFLDIFLEDDLSNGSITELDAQSIIDSFYLQMSLFKFSLSPNLFKDNNYEDSFFFSETFSEHNICKTTYRFLNSLKKFKLYPYNLNLCFTTSSDSIDDCQNFFDFFDNIRDELLSFSFYNPNSFKKNINISFDYNGQGYVPSEDSVFNMGIVDLEKLFYLTLNGGKDVDSNSNLTPISQPIRKNDFSYEEFVTKFKDFFAYSMNNFIDFYNIINHLNSKNKNFKLKNSLSYYITFLNPQVTFINLEKITNQLTAIKNNNFEILRDRKGWITNVIVKDQSSDDSIFYEVVNFIEKEVKKIPLFKIGDINIRFLQSDKDEFIDFVDLNKKHTVIPELSTSKFSFNVLGTPSINEILTNSENGYSSLHFTNPLYNYKNRLGLIIKNK